MAALAFKAIDYGAEQIPDKFFEKIPGGFFTPEEKKKNRAARRKHQDAKHHEEDSRRPRRDHSPQTDYSSYSDRESDYERERRRRDRDRPRSMSRGRDVRSKDLNRDLDGRDMAYAEQGQSSGPYFPPPPTSEHRPYHPQDHPRSGQDEYRPSSAMPTYGYPPQPAAAQPYPTQSPMGQRSGSSPVAYGEEAAYRYETIQNARGSQAQQPSSHTAARYTPGPGYAPSPVSMPHASIPPPPVGVNSPPVGSSAPYAPYDPSTYASQNPVHPVTANGRPSQPPFYRQHSRSQPSVVTETNSQYPVYAPRSSEQQVAQNDYPPSRRSSTKPERRDNRHRARSADSRNDRNRENSRMSDMRGRFDSMDLQKKGLAAAVGGALAGGFAGRAMGRGKTSRLTTLAGVAAGALGGQAIANRSGDRSRDSRRSPSRSRSRHRKRDDRGKSRERSKSRGLRARSRSIASRFRSKSRGRDDREKVSDRSSRRPDRGYEVREEYESFTESDSEGSPVRRHRRRTTKRKEY